VTTRASPGGTATPTARTYCAEIGAACVVALVGRFAQHCHRLEIDAPSWREKNAFNRIESRNEGWVLIRLPGGLSG
jgi:hypothetical protein